MSALTTELGRRVRRPSVLYWIAPIGVWAVVAQPIPLPFLDARTVLAAIVALLGIAVASRFPAPSLRVLFLLLPFANLTFAFLYKSGVPAQLLRPAGFWKELVIVAVGVVAAASARREPRRIDLVDRLVLAYLGILVVFLVVPELLVLSGPGADLSFNVRLTGFRQDAFYVLFFFVARHARLPADAVRVVVRAIVVAMALVAALAVFEFIFTERWREFLLFDVDLPRYQLDVLEANADRVSQNLQRLRNRVDASLPRVGSTEINPNALAFPLVAGLALGVEALLHGQRRGMVGAAVAVTAVALLMTQTRSALLAAAIVLFLGLRALPGRNETDRVRAQTFVALALIVVLPLAIAVGLTGRFAGDEASDELHEASLLGGIDSLVETPLGTGLSTAAGAGTRSGVEERVNSENQYLQVGTQYGVVTMAVYIGALLATVRLLRRRADATGDQTVLVGLIGTRSALIGIGVAGLVIPAYVTLFAPWAVWGTAGLALGACERGRQPTDRSGELDLSTSRRRDGAEHR